MEVDESNEEKSVPIVRKIEEQEASESLPIQKKEETQTKEEEQKSKLKTVVTKFYVQMKTGCKKDVCFN